MSELSQADAYLLEQVRAGQEQAWSQVVARYEGRLRAFALSRLGRRADAEDVVQETFISLLKGLEGFRGQASLETYLFTILRRRVVDCYRGRKARQVCLLQDACGSVAEHERGALAEVAGSDPTASWYVRRDEQRAQSGAELAVALRELINGYKKSLNFRDLQLVELLFYCRLGNREAARLVGLGEKNVAVIKHRCLKQLRRRVTPLADAADVLSGELEQTVARLWEQGRLSCPKRSTIGGYVLGTLDEPWLEYVHFHLQTLGCHFCRANLEDLEQANSTPRASLRRRIMESTVGFLHKT